MTLAVRPLVESDKAAWLPLWHGYLEFYETVLDDAQTERTWSRLMDPDYNSYGKVVTVDNLVVGMTHYSFQTSTWAKENYCYLEDLFVVPSSRGSGLGKALINSVLEEANASGSSRLYWNTDATNATARKLYDTFTQVSGKVQYRMRLEER